MPEKRLARVEREFGLLRSVDKVMPHLENDLRVYVRFLSRQRRDKRYKPLAELKKAELLPTIAFVRKSLNEIRDRSGTAKNVAAYLGMLQNTVKSGDRRAIKMDFIDYWPYQDSHLNELKAKWTEANASELRKVIKLPANAELFPYAVGYYTSDEGDLYHFLTREITNNDLSEAKKRGMARKFAAKVAEHGGLMLINPFAHKDATITASDSLHKMYAVNKRLIAEGYKVSTIIAQQTEPQDKHAYLHEFDRLDAIRGKVFRKHDYRVLPSTPERVVAHEKEHDVNDVPMIQIESSIVHRHSGDRTQRDWQLLMMSAFNESFSTRAERIKVRGEGGDKARIVTAKNVFVPRDTFQHTLGTLLAKAYDEARIPKGRVMRDIGEAAEKGALESVASRIAERVRESNPPLYRCIRVMIGEEEPRLHSKFKKAYAEMREATEKDDAKAYEELMRLRMRGK